MIRFNEAKLSCNAPFQFSLAENSAKSAPGMTVFHAVFSNPSAAQSELDECSVSWTLPPEYAHARTAMGGSSTGVPIDLCMADADSKFTSGVFFLFRSDAGKYLLAGTVTWRKLIMEWSCRKSVLTLGIHGDSLLLDGNSAYEADEVVFIEGDTLYGVMDSYGKLIGSFSTRKRKNDLWRGWASWDYLRDDFTHAELMEQLEAVKDLLPPKRENLHHLLQVDDGYSMWGDWLRVKKNNFPQGFDGFVRDANAHGFDVGIWMAPFWAEATSEVATQHPDWFLHDGNGELVKLIMVEHTLVLFDYSQDEVCNWWRETLKTVRSWGVTYYKFDFLSKGLYPAAGKNPMPPLARFHRCFDIISEVLDKDNCYILGCSAELGPCFGRVDGIRIGSDISPNIKEVRHSSFCCIGHYYLQKYVLDCDSDYLVVRGEGERNPKRPEPFPNKFGHLSAGEAQTWCDLSSICSHIVLAGDNMNFIPEVKRNMVKEVMNQTPADEIFAVDVFGGDGSTAAECILSSHSGRTAITLFNWDDAEKTVRFSGPITGTYTIGANRSLKLDYVWEKPFAELAGNLKLERCELPRKRSDSLVKDFPSPVNAVCLPLGEQATCPLRYTRKGQSGMMSGLYTELLEHKTLSNIPFDFSLSRDSVIMQPFHSHETREIPVSGTIKVFYVLYGACCPVRNKVCDIELHYADGTKTAFPVVCEDNIGNTDIRYLFQWNERDARVCWVDNFTFACMYVGRFVNPAPEKAVTKIVFTEQLQQGTMYVAGLTKADN